MPPRKRSTSSEPADTPRIHPQIEHLAVPVGDLQPYHQNPNVGDVEVIRASLRRNGQYKPITVNVGTHTGRANEILAGNHTWESARLEGWPEIAATYIDVDEQAAKAIVAADNRTAEKAKRDPDLLAALLGSLDDLEGTGYTQEDLGKLLGDASVTDNDEAFVSRFELVIECRDEDHQRELYEKLDAEGLTVRVLSM